MKRYALAFLLLVALSLAASAQQLTAMNKKGEPAGTCPLKQTDVKAEISGFLTHVTVVQTFHNPFPDKIDAVYTFPLSDDGAVYDMMMKVGERTIRGEIHPREKAREIYEAARQKGHVASLLDQERPNIFTQSVANIEPGKEIQVTIKYLEVLPYEDGSFSFSFPTVVGPRYIPGDQGQQGPGPGWAPNTEQVPDGSRITPPVAPEGTRAGHDISIEVDLDAGLPISRIESVQHEVTVNREGKTKAHVELVNKKTIPNKDFILEYSAAEDSIADAVLTHKAGDEAGSFAVILAPPRRVKAEQILPKELVFVVDTSGSMHGQPMDKVKETMDYALKNLNPKDTFNLITFSGSTTILFPQPVSATPENVAKAREVLSLARAGGGTEMMKAVQAALAPSGSDEHVRIVTFMTDGYVGNDMAIIGEIQKYSGSRVFPFGIGTSVNRFLLDKMAEAGRGQVEYVTLTADSAGVAQDFYERVRNPVLTDIDLQWQGVQVSEVYPQTIPDLFSSQPVVVFGRYDKPGKGKLIISGTAAGKRFTREVALDLPARRAEHDVLPQMWARKKIDELMARDWQGLQRGAVSPELKQSITDLGVKYRLMTQFTSFVAVEEKTVTEGGESRTVVVPVEMPEGVEHEGVFGPGRDQSLMRTREMSAAGASPMALPPPPPPPPPAPAPKPEPASKIDASLRQAASMVGPNRQDFEFDGIKVVKGRLKVAIKLTSVNDENLKLLKELGVAVESSQDGTVVGTIPAEALLKLEKLAFVSSVSPAK